MEGHRPRLQGATIVHPRGLCGGGRLCDQEKCGTGEMCSLYAPLLQGCGFRDRP